MNQPMIIWCIIAGVLLCTFVFRAIEWFSTERRHNDRRPCHILEIGKEEEMFYIPGDIEDDEPEDL